MNIILKDGLWIPRNFHCLIEETLGCKIYCWLIKVRLLCEIELFVEHCMYRIRTIILLVLVVEHLYISSHRSKYFDVLGLI